MPASPRNGACDEVVFLNERGELAEGARTNLFAEIDGALATPPLTAGILDGCLRRELIDTGKCTERTLLPDDLVRATRLYLGNSLRGLIPAVAAEDPRLNSILPLRGEARISASKAYTREKAALGKGGGGRLGDGR